MGSRRHKWVLRRELSPERDLTIENASSRAETQRIEDPNRAPPHPALRRLSALFGHQAAAFVRRYRYAGLGRLQLLSENLRDRGSD